MRIIILSHLLISFLLPQTIHQNEPTCSHLKTAKTMLENHTRMTRNQSAFDVTYYDMDLTINPGPEVISGTVGVTFTSLTDGLDHLELDLHNGLNVSQVIQNGIGLDFDHNDQSILDISLSEAIYEGEATEVIIYYGGFPGSSGFGSFGFDTHAGEHMIWTLSEPYGARNWWPCKDTPMDKADSVDISIKVPENLIVASNGLLVGEESANGWKTYHWQERYPIATYLVSLAIYPYLVYYDWFHYGENDSMRLDYYVYPDHYYEVYDNYGLTKNMIAGFSTRFGLYPFINEKYGHAEFVWGGGMEHQTITSMGGYSQHLISHELGHQWWGDMVTCASFHHIWLNEGFATYSQAMWYEIRDNSIQSLHNEMADKQYFGGGTIYVEDTTQVWDIFNGNLSYNKAAWVLHMLRHVVGDSLFFEGLQEYGDRYKFSSTITEDFRDVMAEVSGRNLDAFFDRWIYGEYYPSYQTYPSYFDLGNGTSQVNLIITQLQSTPLFEMPIDVEILTTMGTYTFIAENNQQDQMFSFIVYGIPLQVRLDPNHWILRTVQDGDLVTGIAVSHMADWNLVGLPLSVEDNSVETIYPGHISGTLYGFDGTYFNIFELLEGHGYWLNFPESGINIVMGDALNELTINLTEDWNLISGISTIVNIENIEDTVALIIPNTVYKYTANGYENTDIIEPGKGYWVRASGDGDIVLSSAVSVLKTDEFINRLTGANRISFNGNTLYFGINVPEDEKLSYSLPPLPPPGGFDVRFVGDWKYCEDSGRIDVRNNVELLSISYAVVNPEDEMEWVLTTETGDSFVLEDSGNMEVSGDISRFYLSKQVASVSSGTGSDVPGEFILHQNYPNPFNAITTIRYSVNGTGKVTLEIIDLLGKTVWKKEDQQGIGSHSVIWDGRDQSGKSIPSGLYFIHATFNQNNYTKRLLLLR